MPKKKYTNDDAREDFKALRDSCSEGLSGEWDSSTDEGKEGFEAMLRLIDRLTAHFGIKNG